MKALVYTKSYRVVYRDEPDPTPGRDEVRTHREYVLVADHLDNPVLAIAEAADIVVLDVDIDCGLIDGVAADNGHAPERPAPTRYVLPFVPEGVRPDS